MNLLFPLEQFAAWMAFHVFRLQEQSVLGEAVNFFIYDSVKILLLLCSIIFVISFIRTYLPPERIKKILSKKFPLLSNIIAALIGVVTPFCSCSAVPLFIGFVESGVPLGATFSYLISAPMVNEVALVLLLGLFGWKIALLYIASGVTIAIVAGAVLGKMRLEHLVEDYVWKIKVKNELTMEQPALRQRARQAYQETGSIVKKIALYILLGVAIGAAIHGYAPENLLATIAGKGNWLAVPIAVLIGVPLYSNAAGIIPVVKSLMEKGLPLGTSLAFMMSVTALSLPEMIILRKVLKPRLLAIYIGIVTIGIIFTGYLFNILI